MSSFSEQSGCDDAIKCGSARGKSALLWSLPRKYCSFYTCETYVRLTTFCLAVFTARHIAH